MHVFSLSFSPTHRLSRQIQTRKRSRASRVPARLLVSRSREFDVSGAHCDAANGSGKPRVEDDEPDGCGSAWVKATSSGHEFGFTLRFYQNRPPRVPAQGSALLRIFRPQRTTRLLTGQLRIDAGVSSTLADDLLFHRFLASRHHFSVAPVEPTRARDPWLDRLSRIVERRSVRGR